ncbi:MAG: histidine phosphatase family protein [Candidatus Puniceispirillaceae bacterium]
MTDHPDIAEIFFIRHAPVAKLAGHVPPADPPILDQTYALDALVETLPQGAIWHVSPLTRAHQTAALLTPGLAPAAMREDERLAEMEFGTWADRPVAEVWDEIKDGPLHNWSFVTASRKPPDGESFDELVMRVGAWMEDLAADFAPAQHVVVTHAGVIRAMMCKVLAAPPDHCIGIPVPHFGVARVTLMDPARATADGGPWLFAGLSDPRAVRAGSGG